MGSFLIGTHAGLGEVGAVLFLWVFVELLNPTEQRVRRAKFAAILGTLFLFASWFVGGYYYVEYYGPLVKPLIKSGPWPWAHAVFTETKEHVFLFLPFLALFVTGLISRFKNEVLNNSKVKRNILWVTILIVLIAFAMAGMGYLMSTGYRNAVEVAMII